MRVNIKHEWLKLTFVVGLVIGIFFVSSVAFAQKKVPIKAMVIDHPLEDSANPLTGQILLGYNHVVDEFNKTHPNINLELINVPWGAHIAPYAKALMELKSNEFDVVQGALSYISLGLYEPLTRYVERDDYDLNRIWSNMLYWAKLPGDKELQLFSMAIHASVYPLAYDKRIFDDYGVPYLSKYPSLDEWITKVKRLSGTSPRTGEKTYGFWLAANHQEYLFQIIVRCLGGQYCTEDTKYPTLFTKESIEAAQILIDLSKAGVFRSDYLTASQPAGWLTKENSIAMVGEPRVVNMTLAGKTSDEIGISTWPINPFGYAGYLSGGDMAFGINALSNHKDEAWEFLKFWQTKSQQIFQFNSAGWKLPTLKDWGEWNIPIVNELRKAGYLEVLWKGTALADPLAGNTVEMFSVGRPIIRSELQGAMMGEYGAKEACKRMQDQILERLKY